MPGHTGLRSIERKKRMLHEVSVGMSGGEWGDNSNSVERGAQRLEGRASGLPESLGTRGLAAASRLASPVGVKSQPAKAAAGSQPLTEL